MAVTSGSCFSFSTLTKLMVTESEDREEWREGEVEEGWDCSDTCPDGRFVDI